MGIKLAKDVEAEEYAKLRSEVEKSLNLKDDDEGYIRGLYKKIPTNVRLLMENLTGVDTPITARDFTREELIEMATLAERQKRRNLKREKRFNTIIKKELAKGPPDKDTEEMLADYRDMVASYEKTRGKTSVNPYGTRKNKQVDLDYADAIKRTFTDPKYNVATSLGKYNVFDRNGKNLKIRDTYNFNIGERRLPTDFKSALSNMMISPELAGEYLANFLETKDRPVNIDIPKKQILERKRAMFSGGDVMDEDITKAKNPKYDFSNKNLINLPQKVLEGYLTEKYGVDRYVRERSSVFDEVSKNKISDRESILTGPELEALSIAFEEQMKKQQGKKKGGMPKQMEMFEDGGLKDEGGEVDEESGNEVPPGSTKEEVRDDIPARLSEGEFVFPADVVRYLGLDFLMKLRQRAKAGLQKMEEMGQMGNSDEATLPDDIPFTIDDLDMEDDPLEMQVGGVVPNPMGNPTAMPNQVTTMNTPNVYNPNMGQMYTPGGVTPYAPATFKSLLPQSSTGQVKTESRKYTKGSQVRFVPFIVGTGQPLNPAQLAQLEADGFTLDTGISPTKKDDTTKTETTKVKPVDTGGDDSGSAKVSSATLSIGGDKDPNRPGLQTGATTFDLKYNVPGSLPGIASIASLPGIIGGKAPKGTTVDMTKGNITKTVSFEDFMKIKNDVTGQFAKDFVKNINNLDKLNKNTIAFDSVKNTYVDKTTNEEVDYDTVTKLGEDIADRLEKKTRDKSFLGFDVSTSATDAYNELSDSEKDAYNDYATEQQEQEEGDRIGSVPTSFTPSTGMFDSDDEDEQQSYDSPSDDGGGFEDTGSVTEDDSGMFSDAFGSGDYKGAFVGEKYKTNKGLLRRKPKVKKMKRGGLASR